MEADLDLCGSACSTCDCLDTAPYEKEGCTVDVSPHGPVTLSFILLTIVGLRRRYR
jgi:hypothetical protein